MTETLGLSLDRVTFLRGKGRKTARPIIKEISQTFSPSQVTLITGPTGSGKSTLIRLLGGLIRPVEGEVRADGEPISRWVAAHRDRWRQDVGMTLQHAQLIPGLSALENVMVRRLPRCESLDRLRAEARENLKLLDASHLTARAVEELSGGEGQRVALARALAGRPRFLLLDEPSAHQDTVGLERIVDVVQKAKGWKAVVVIATHDPRLLEAGIADVTLRLVDGRLEESSSS